MVRRLARLIGALGAGALLALVWAVGLHGFGRDVLRLASEPRADVVPRTSFIPPADRPVHVLLLGTSLTAGGDWAHALERQLAACHRGGVVVERLAKPGANSAWGARVLAVRLVEAPIPDLLVVEFSINDASLWRGITLEQSRARHEEMLMAAKRAGITVWLATMSPAFGRKALERPGHLAYRSLYHDLALANNAGLIATTPAWQALSPDDRMAALPDDLHPTDAAMVAIAVPAYASALGSVVCGAR